MAPGQPDCSSRGSKCSTVAALGTLGTLPRSNNEEGAAVRLDVSHVPPQPCLLRAISTNSPTLLFPLTQTLLALVPMKGLFCPRRQELTCIPESWLSCHPSLRPHGPTPWSFLEQSDAQIIVNLSQGWGVYTSIHRHCPDRLWLTRAVRED